MALPVLESAKYQTTIPSTGETIEFRPFLVREEKLLLLAQESEDATEIARALKDIVTACTFEKIDVNELAVYDLEYLFLQLRAKSVGENVELHLKCKSCESLNITEVDLGKIKVNKPRKKVDSNIKLSDTVGMTLRSIPVSEMDSISEETEDFIRVIGLCVETIYDENKVYSRSDFTENELCQFIEQLSHQHLEMVDNFISNQPRLSHKLKIKCENCKTEIVQELEGLQDFFV